MKKRCLLYCAKSHYLSVVEIISCVLKVTRWIFILVYLKIAFRFLNRLLNSKYVNSFSCLGDLSKVFYATCAYKIIIVAVLVSCFIYFYSLLHLSNKNRI